MALTNVSSLRREAPDADKPTIVFSQHAASAAADQAIEHLAKQEVFQRAGRLVDFVRDAHVDDKRGIIRPQGSPRIRELPFPALRERLSNCAAWTKMRRRRRGPEGTEGKLEQVATTVPSDVVSIIHSRGQWAHVRPIVGCVDWPCLRPDGTVLASEGYDLGTRLYCSPNVALDIPKRPSWADAKKALAELEALVVDFPFAAPPHRAGWIAAVLTLLARPAIAGPTPMFLVDANTRGVGKTKLAGLVGQLVMGREMPVQSVPEGREEWRKAIMSIALAADPAVIFDNVTHTLRSDTLDAVLTSTVFKQRALGSNDSLEVPWHTVTLATANNASLSTDLVRRTVHIRLDSPQERPELRDGFTHPDLDAYVAEHRARLLGAALTILRAYQAAGCPVVDMRPMGSFEAWSRVVRAALVWAGAADPAEAQDELRESADPEREGSAELLTAWHRCLGERPQTCGDIIRIVSDDAPDPSTRALADALAQVCDTPPGKPPSARTLGYRLRDLRGVTIGGLRLEKSKAVNHANVAQYRVRAA